MGRKGPPGKALPATPEGPFPGSKKHEKSLFFSLKKAYFP
jgi:hypothetical protein